jgi:hypothetical protein
MSNEQFLPSDPHPQDASRSYRIDELYAALAVAQKSFRIAAERQYKAARGSYPRLADLYIATRDALSDNGLEVNFKLFTDDVKGSDYLRTQLVHRSGQWDSATVRFVYPKDDLDAWQSCLDKLKREQYKAITGCVSDEEDDGMKAMDSHYERKERGTAVNITYDVKAAGGDFITTDQLEMVKTEPYLKKYASDLLPQILGRYKINHLHELRKSQLDDVLTWIRKTGLMRDGLREADPRS